MLESVKKYSYQRENNIGLTDDISYTILRKETLGGFLWMIKE